MKVIWLANQCQCVGINNQWRNNGNEIIIINEMQSIMSMNNNVNNVINNMALAYPIWQ
jgi:hypothetical protein